MSKQELIEDLKYFQSWAGDKGEEVITITDLMTLLDRHIPNDSIVDKAIIRVAEIEKADPLMTDRERIYRQKVLAILSDLKQ